MPPPPSPHVRCRVLVLRLETAAVADEDLAEQVRDELVSCFRALQPQHVVLDLQNVSHLNSSGFRPLLSLLREVRSVSGRLILCRLQPNVREVLLITHLLSPDGKAPAPLEATEDLASSFSLLGLASVDS